MTQTPHDSIHDGAIVVSEYLMEPFVERLGERHTVVYDPDLYGDRARLLGEVSGAVAILIRNRTRVDAELLDRSPNLRVIGRLGVGLDNIDLIACDRAGVEVIPAIGANSISVAEYVIGAMMTLARGVFGMTTRMVSGEWPRQGHAFGVELAGKVLGLVGYGSIARLVARRAAALEMTVLAHDPYVSAEDPDWRWARSVTLSELFEQSDFVSVHTALNDETRGMIDRASLEAMKHEAVLINTSRGNVIDENALIEALRTGSIAGAALDVFEEEPLGPDRGARFAGIENLLLTPHVAGNTRESVDRVADVVVSAVLDRLAD